MRDRKQIYLEIWRRIGNLYIDGYIANERTLQAELYAELRKELPGVHIVVEPTWNVGNDSMKPDLVIVEEDQITDVFELKFRIAAPPLSFKDVEKDIQKLLHYVVKEKYYPVRLDHFTRMTIDDTPVWDACRLHFVSVTNARTAAVRSTSVRECVRALKEEEPELNKDPRALSCWSGQVEDGTDENAEEWPNGAWSIEFGIR